MANQYRHTSHTTFNCLYHIVWITKYRKRVLKDDIGLRCREILRQICNTNKVEIINGAIGGDHVHVLLSIPPYMEFPILKKQFWGQHFWQIGYFCSTTGSVTEKTVRDYIAQQGKREEDDDRTFIMLD